MITAPMKTVLALDIGGTKTTAALVDLEGDTARVRHHLTGPTPAAAGPDAVLDHAISLVCEVRGKESAVALGIASAGVVTAVGTISHATSALPGWAGTDLVGTFTQRLGIPVAALNDVHGHAVGEARYGAGRGAHSILLVAIGTGIGAAHVIGGQPVVGVRGAAGHVGHLPVPEAQDIHCPCGRSGHLEGLASGPGILALAARFGVRDDAGPVTDGVRLAALAREKSTAAAEAYRVAGFATGRTIGGALNLLDVERVILTGGVAAVGEPWRGAVLQGIEHEAMDVVSTTEVTMATAGTHAALLGAAAWAVDLIEEQGAQ